jgi:hypothetical protein
MLEFNGYAVKHVVNIVNLKAVSAVPTQKGFRHLAARRVAGTQKQHSRFLCC